MGKNKSGEEYYRRIYGIEEIRDGRWNLLVSKCKPPYKVVATSIPPY